MRIAQLLRNPLGHLLHETIAVKPKDRAVVMPFAIGTFPFPHYNSRFQNGWANGKLQMVKGKWRNVTVQGHNIIYTVTSHRIL